ncbi:hypothetical protein [Lysinibacillus sp. C5.1]|uniref:hypothetical protein n=1 Tax=Lysinibacillus sp. C5.1 TaxID=2796169 RepID=UPI0030814B02
MKVKIGRTNGSIETLENVKEVTKEEYGVLIIKEQNEELFIPYANLAFYLVSKE